MVPGLQHLTNRARFLAPLLLILGAARISAAQSSSDTVRILSISPHDSLQAGSQATLRIELETTLHSADSGSVRIGFNTKSARGWLTRDSRVIHAGTEHVTFDVQTIPADWGATVQFSLAVSIVDAVKPSPGSRPTTVVYQSIPVRP